MSMSWTGKIKSALQGEVDGADALARLAVAAPLVDLRRRLADRRLEVEIGSLDEEWRVPDALAMAAAPLWAADGLISLAQSFSDAEAQAHADRPSAMAALSHGQILALLEPVDGIQAEVGAVLADPARRPALALPIAARPFSPSGAGLMAERIHVPYLRGLLAGATSLTGAAQILSEDYTALVQRSPGPRWLVNGYAALAGDLAAAQARLEALQARAAPLFRQASPDETALRTLAIDCWQLANSLLRIGQLYAAPSLLPNSEPLRPRSAAQAIAPPPVPKVQAAPAIPIRPPQVPPPPAPHAAPPEAAPARDPAPAQPARPVGSTSAPDLGLSHAHPAPPQHATAPPAGTGAAQAATRTVQRTERWLLSSSGARHRLRAAGQEDQAERDMAAFWSARGWVLSATEARYLDEVADLATRGVVVPSGRSMAACPFATIFRLVGGSAQVLGQPLLSGSSFSYDFLPGGQGLLADLSPAVGIADAK